MSSPSSPVTGPGARPSGATPASTVLSAAPPATNPAAHPGPGDPPPTLERFQRSGAPTPGNPTPGGDLPDGSDDAGATAGALTGATAGALTGVRVLRLGRSRAGDLLERLLTEQGAQVTAVPGSVAAAARAAIGLLAEHDVLVDDAGRGVLAAHGLSPAEAARHNGQLVHCSIVALPAGADPADALPPDGNPARGPHGAGPRKPAGSALADLNGRSGTDGDTDEASVDEHAPGGYELDDTAIAALLGLHRMSGLPLRAEPLPVASLYGAVLAAVHIVAALLARVDRPASVHFEVPLLAAAATALSRERIVVEDERLVDIATVPHLPHVELYECADGRYLQPHGLYAEFVRVICRVAGRPEWADEAVAALDRLPDQAAVHSWRERLRAVFLERPAIEWEREINAAAGAATMTRTPEEWSAEPHATAARILATDQVRTAADAADATRIPPPGPAVRVSLAAAPPGTAAPSAARRWAPPDPARDPGPLSGVRVVDFCIVLAGPTCARILADLGAEVVKVDDPRRPISPFPWLDVNRGKRSTVIDLNTDAGVRLVRRLVDGADVVVQNFRAGKIDRLGFGVDRLRHERPDLVYASLNAFDFDGPWQERAGWEHNAQAASGMQSLRARDGVPRQVPFPVNDYATGLLGAYGVCLALLHRRRTGAGGHVRASLARSATCLLRAVPERPDPYLPIECTDGWVWAATSLPEGAAPAASLPDGTAPALPASGATRAETLRRLRAANTPAVPELDLHDPHTRTWLRSYGVLSRWRHRRLGWIDQLTPAVHGDLFAVPGHPAPEPGDDTDTVLAEAGVDKDELAHLRETGVIAGPLYFFPDVPLTPEPDVPLPPAPPAAATATATPEPLAARRPVDATSSSPGATAAGTRGAAD